MTFSIIGVDREDQMVGSAVASRWTGVGGCVQFFRPGVGFINIQNHSYAQVAYRILDNLGENMRPEKAVQKALEIDKAKDSRQCIIYSFHHDELFVYSGSNCTAPFYHRVSDNCAAAGNTLSNTHVIDAMTNAFEASADQPITERLIRALEAGQENGGDYRGQEAAAVKAYRFHYPIQRFYPVDLRVDHNDKPLEEIRKLYKIFGERERRVLLAPKSD